MSTKSKSETTQTAAVKTKSENSVVFGPLGKYAVVAIIMVSIIITTAIMLGKQLSTIDQELAAIENTVIQAYAKETVADNKAAVTEIPAVAAPAPAAVTPTAEAATSIAPTAVIEETTETIAVVETASKVVATEEPAADVLVMTETTPATEAAITEAVATEQSPTTADAAPFELTDDRKIQQQARIEAIKTQQKQRMTEMFARIKALESQQLDQYKSNQEDQIARLREQIAMQQKTIEALILRNKDHYDLRAANMKRVQSTREQMLNRI